mmetsp:Transcript_13958/g.29443  ORF Transcript_13958/g.29443 Transcript_13958/m.29443 type:complete len:363 (+) Transcript_13958:1070-2158(+)
MSSTFWPRASAKTWRCVSAARPSSRSSSHQASRFTLPAHSRHLPPSRAPRSRRYPRYLYRTLATSRPPPPPSPPPRPPPARRHLSRVLRRRRCRGRQHSWSHARGTEEPADCAPAGAWSRPAQGRARLLHESLYYVWWTRLHHDLPFLRWHHQDQDPARDAAAQLRMAGRALLHLDVHHHVALHVQPGRHLLLRRLRPGPCTSRPAGLCGQVSAHLPERMAFDPAGAHPLDGDAGCVGLHHLVDEARPGAVPLPASGRDHHNRHRHSPLLHGSAHPAPTAPLRHPVGRDRARRPDHRGRHQRADRPRLRERSLRGVAAIALVLRIQDAERFALNFAEGFVLKFSLNISAATRVSRPLWPLCG